MGDKPLQGLRVLDLTRILAGPFCTMILKNLGAEVIKVERAGVGDEARTFGPFIDTAKTKSTYFMSINSGKRSLCLDLKKEKGRKILSDLVKRSDVLVENFKPGTLARLGYSKQKLLELNPDLIYVSSSGFGHTGPDAHKPAYDMVIQALSGIMSITGLADGRTTRVGTSITDIVAGMFAAIGVLSALYRRSLTHSGARVDVAMLDGAVAVLENAVARYQVDKINPRPLGSRHPSITPFASFKTCDSEIVIATGTDKQFLDLCDLLGKQELKTDKRFTSNHLRTQNVEVLTDIINGVLSSDTTASWLTKLEKAGLPCAPVNKIEDLFKSEQLRARNMFLPVDGEEDFTIVGNPVKFGDVPEDRTAGKSPALGEHNEEILGGLLKFSKGEIEALYEEGVLYKA